MDVELLVIPGCPHAVSAHRLLRQALDDIGLCHLAIRTTVINDDQDAQRRGFVGSPTFEADGHDLFADASAPPAWACRLYRTTDGTAPLPDLWQLRQAIKRAADTRAAA